MRESARKNSLPHCGGTDKWMSHLSNGDGIIGSHLIWGIHLGASICQIEN